MASAKFGFTLCDRGRAGFQLTERGRVVLQKYTDLVSQMNLFQHNVNSLREQTVGSLSIGLLDHTITESGFSTVDLLKTFIAEAPGVHITMVQDISTELTRAVVEGTLDVAIGAFETDHELVSSQRLYVEHQNVYCGAGHPFFERALSLPIPQVEQANWVMRGYPLDPVRTLQLTPSRSTATAANLESVATIVIAGHHIAFLPEHFARPFEERGQLRRINPKKLSAKVDFSLITRAGRRKTQAMQLFADHAKRVAICKQAT